MTGQIWMDIKVKLKPFFTSLRNGGSTLRTELGEGVGHVAGNIGALGLASVIGVERHLAVEGGSGVGDAGFDGQTWIDQAEMDAALNRTATSGGSTCGRAKVQKTLHHPVRRRREVVIQR